MLAFACPAPTAVVAGLAAERSLVAESSGDLCFFRSVAVMRDDGTCLLRVHGHFGRRKPNSVWRRVIVRAFGRRLGLTAEQRRSEVFRARAMAFLVDNHGDRRTTILVGGRMVEGARSGAHGHFGCEIELSAAECRAADGLLRFGSALGNSGEATVLTPCGLSVVSDIDDTVRISHIGDRRRMLEGTFLRPFEPVAGMAALYERLRALGTPTAPTTFHYLSASPWQLYEPLVEFLDAHGFPKGSLHLRRWRVKDSSYGALFRSARPHKEAVVRQLIEDVPRRRIVLVGDSSQEDAEIFTDLARAFPESICLVAIRQGEAAPLSRERIERASAELGERWMLFRGATEWESVMEQMRN